METTFGLPRYRFPPTAEVISHVLAFCHEALEQKAVPILLSYSLGKSKEIVCALLADKAGMSSPSQAGSVFRGGTG
jgi:hypothetical protein